MYKRQCQSSELLTLGTHPWIVTCLAVSPDGRWVASGSQDQPGDGSQSLKVWDLSLGREAGAAGRTFGASNTLWSLAFSTDSRTLISAGERGVRFWNVATGAEQPAPPLPLAREIALAGQTLVLSPNHPFVSNEPLSPLWLYDLQSGQGRELGVSGRHPALSPDGRQLAFLTAAMEIQVMDLSTPGRVRTVATQRPAFRLRFSPDGQRLAAAGHSAEARIWDLTPWEKNPDASLSAPLSFSHEHNVWDVCFSPDGNRLITATSNQRLEAWESRTARSLGRWTGHAGEVWTVLMTPDGQHLVSGGKDQTVRLWSSTPPTLATSAPHWRYARPAFAPNGQLLYTYVQASGGGGSTEIWNLNGDGAIGTKVFSTRGFARGFAPDGRHLLFLSEEPPTLEWKPLDAHAPTRRVQLRDVAHPMIRGEFLLAGDNRSFVCPDIGGGLSRWSTEDGSRTASMTNALLARQIERLTRGGSIPDRLVRSAAISRRGRWVAFGCFDTGGTLLLDLEHPQSGGQLLAGHRDDVSALAFSEDESTLASGSVDGTIRLWSTTDGTLKANLPGHLESVEAVAFSPDGRTLVSVNPGIELKLWHLPTLREIACIPAPEAGLHLAFSPSGESLAVGLTPGRREGGSDRVELWRAPRPNGL